MARRGAAAPACPAALPRRPPSPCRPGAPHSSCLPQKESKAKQAERLAAGRKQLESWEGERYLLHTLRANLETCRCACAACAARLTGGHGI